MSMTAAAARRSKYRHISKIVNGFSLLAYLADNIIVINFEMIMYHGIVSTMC